ncbi:hypothetical protein B0H15DRAFT_870927 [Mycena belliarum]|uniref:Uncharacterized protein n=1 Tax=Mycena belliarum TaxID=1033014 RepID=A0AAD6TP37_9AGAR|nr:hypothetical protein B0H15DRAFT_870927 [Mycena belliae]
MPASPSPGPSGNNATEPPDEDWKTAVEKRRERRRAADRRYYQNNPGVKEKKRVKMAEKRASVKAARRKWDPVKASKPSPREDPNEARFPSEDENLLSSADEARARLNMDELCSDYQYELIMEAAANGSSDNKDFRGSDSEECCSDMGAEGEGDYHPALNKDCCESHMVRANDEVSVAETLATMSGLVGPAAAVHPSLGETSASPGPADSEQAPIRTNEMSTCRPVSEEYEQPATGTAAVMVISIDGLPLVPAAPRPRIFRGYRYIPSGPVPNIPRVISAPRPEATGICGKCPTVQECDHGGDDGEGLCGRCIDCQVGGYACWDHFNGVKEWEESLW